jgi:hypothetical protein
MSIHQPLTPRQKALEINIDNKIYGSFAEIGAGQEVVRNFFRAGGAAGTVARSISAYDMAMSDAIYGRTEDGRYVSIHRLKKMLSYEYDTLIDKLIDTREEGTRFFAFADTVSAKGFKGNKPCHGWVGVRFQHEASSGFSEVILHVKLHDRQAVAQYETIGMLGVNLLHACFHHITNYKQLVSALMDNLSKDSIEIDMISASGPAFQNIDTRVLNLELVTQGHTKITIFDENGQIQPTADTLYKKNLLVLRGSFRPPTHINMDMLDCGLEQFALELNMSVDDPSITVLPEISMNNLRGFRPDGEIENEDFLARIDLLNALGKKVMITNYDDFYCLNMELSNLSRKKLSFVLGVFNMGELFDAERFNKLDFGLLGALGSMFNPDTRIYIYPQKAEQSEELLTFRNIELTGELHLLKEYLMNRGRIHDLTNCRKEYMSIWSRDILKMIEEGDSQWEQYVPEVIAKTVNERSLFKNSE